MAIVWRDKLLAFSVHFIVTGLLAAAAAALIFLVWYPDPFQLMVRGLELFMLVVGVDLALGPLCSFVIFNRNKTRRALVFDYTIVGIVQVAAMVYGVYTVAESRPVYLAFASDRFEVVAARDLLPAELATASAPRYAKVPITGPRLVAVIVPENLRQQSLFDELGGKPAHVRPRYYQEFPAALDRIRKHALTLDVLEKRHAGVKPLLAETLDGLQVPVEKLRWLPVSTRGGFWTAIVDYDTGEPLRYFEFDPY
jgi:hypothetical protein